MESGRGVRGQLRPAAQGPSSTSGRLGFCGRSNGRWCSMQGWLGVGASVCAGETVAAAYAVQVLTPEGRVITDCLSVWRMWHRIRRNPGSVSRGVSHPSWILLAEALAENPSAKCSWMRSHLNAEQAAAEGYPLSWHAGNDKADELAKAVAASRNLPAELLSQHRQHVAEAEQVAGVLAAIQLARLKARARTTDGGAVKVRSRPVPGLPRRLRAKGLKRKLGGARAAATAAAGVGHQAEARSCEQLLQAKAHELPSQDAARQAVVGSVGPAIGIHDLRPTGLWPAAGTVAAKNGRIPGAWGCARCNKAASDTSRARELARKPCGGAEWAATAVCHTLVAEAGQWRCTRCQLGVRPQHAAQCERQRCPVPAITAAGNPWPEGEAGLREVLGRIRAFRHYCSPQAAVEEPADADEPVQQQQVHAQLPCARFQQIRRHAVDQVVGGLVEGPGQAAGGPGSQRSDASSGGAEPPLRKRRLEAEKEQQLFGRSAASTASGSGAASSGHGTAADRANPLAVAGGAQERRNLKQGGLPEAEGPEAELAAVPCLEGAAAMRAWKCPGHDPEARVGHCPEARAGGVAYVAGATEGQECPGSAASANAEPPRFSLQAYEGHAVAFVGRNLWCLKCFEVPRSAHRSWKHGRCGGVRPPTAMPPALRDGMLRQSAACPKLHASTRARWAVLAGALGLQ